MRLAQMKGMDAEGALEKIESTLAGGHASAPTAYLSALLSKFAKHVN